MYLPSSLRILGIGDDWTGCLVTGEGWVGEGLLRFGVHVGSGGLGSGETARFALPNRQGGMAPEARRFASWSITQFESRFLSVFVSGRS